MTCLSGEFSGAAIYGPGTNLVECGADMLRLLGHKMPPAGDGLETAEC